MGGRKRGALVGVALVVVIGLMSFPRLLFGSDQSRAKELIQQACVQCHRLEGQADSRFNLRAPDLIWAGSKYQRSWLIRWLTGKEAPLYAKGYRWDLSEGAVKHPPAIHANINFTEVPVEYLYNMINYGGAAMGKSANMPYWGLTIGQQGVADVMAYLKVTFKGPK